MSIAAALDPHERRRIGLLTAVADPLRVRLLQQLDRPRSVSDLCGALEMAQPRVSHHLAILRAAGMVEATPDGRRRLYRWRDPEDADTAEIQSLIRRWFGLPGPEAVPPSTPSPAPVADEIEDYLL